jgi:uncharacterized protein DUF1810
MAASEKPINAVLGSPDDIKFRSSMTLFDAVSKHEIFAEAWDRAQWIRLLNMRPHFADVELGDFGEFWAIRFHSVARRPNTMFLGLILRRISQRRDQDSALLQEHDRSRVSPSIQSTDELAVLSRNRCEPRTPFALAN